MATSDVFKELRAVLARMPDDGPSDAMTESDYSLHRLPADFEHQDDREALTETHLAEFRAICREFAQLHPNPEIRDYFVRAEAFARVTYGMARTLSPFVVRSRLLRALHTRQLADGTRAEKAVVLEIVMGALDLYPYPPATRIIQHNIAHMQAPRDTPPVIEKLRGELAALEPAVFLKVFYDMMNPLRRWREWDYKAGKYW